MQRSFTAPHHFLKHDGSSSLAQRCCSAVGPVSSFMERQTGKVKQNICSIVVYIDTDVFFISAFRQCRHMPYVAEFFVNCLMNHSLNTVFGVEF